MLDVRNFEKSFNAGTPNEVHALRGINLTLDSGDFAIVIGTNGSGKSTLLNAVAGAFEPDSGTISVSGINITRWQEHQRAKLIGRVFQNPFSGTAPNMSIEENLALASRRAKTRGLGWALKPGLRSEFRDRIARLRMGLEKRLGNPIGTLSGGQRQAVTLLMATWLTPKLLLLDEHTAALDPKSADQIIRMTREIIAEENLTALMVTHSMSQAVELGDRLIMMDNGRITHNLSRSEKAALTVDDLLLKFDELRLQA